MTFWNLFPFLSFPQVIIGGLSLPGFAELRIDNKFRPGGNSNGFIIYPAHQIIILKLLKAYNLITILWPSIYLLPVV
jgi:hypothetical protein